MVKRTRITEGTNFELRASFLNAFNQTNFLLGAAVSGANDPGGRLVEFQLRFNF